MAHASFDYCYQIVRKSDPDRYWLCLTAPRFKQPILMALCAFNVELSRVGELTKDPLLAQIRLQWWRDWIDQISNSSLRGAVSYIPISWLLTQTSLQADHLKTLIEGREHEIDGPIKDYNQFLLYLDQTSGHLSMVIAQELYPNPLSLMMGQCAKLIGIAWGILGVIRAIPFQASAGRCLLPQDLMKKNNLSEHTVFLPDNRLFLQEICRDLATYAQQLLGEAKNIAQDNNLILVKFLRAQRQLAVLYHRRLEKAAFNPFAPSIIPSPYLRMWQILSS